MPGLSLPTARDWMARPACVFKPGDRVLDAIDRLLDHGLAAAPVVGEDGKLAGMITEKDCMRILTSITYEHGWELGTVADYQSKVLAVCEPDMDLFRIAELFLQNNFPVLPVEENGNLVGTISRQSMLRGIQILRREVDRARSRFEETAGKQADRPLAIEDMQRAAALHSRDALVRLFRR